MRALVTGGGGFLGAALVRALRARLDSVRVLARGDYPELRAIGAETVRGDIRDREATLAACAGVELVFHTAAKAGGWGPAAEYESTNVSGTENVIEACRRAGVRALVYTSSPSVVHDGRDLENADESQPYASHFLAHYPRTKALAEQLVRAASDARLATVALRPHFIWGPGDNHLLPRLVSRARAGRLRRIGSRDPKVDTIYIDNCVSAHLLAADRLLADTSSGGTGIGGRTYFVSDGDPVPIWSMAARMLAAVNAPLPGAAVPVWFAYAVGATLEAAHLALRIEGEPVLTRFAVSELTHAQWFSIEAARRDLGYSPLVSIEEGLRRLAASWRMTDDR